MRIAAMVQRAAVLLALASAINNSVVRAADGDLPCFTEVGCSSSYYNLMVGLFSDVAPVGSAYGPVYSYEKCRRGEPQGYQTCVYTATGSTKSYVPLFSHMSCENASLSYCLPQTKFVLSDLRELDNATRYCDRCVDTGKGQQMEECLANVHSWLNPANPSKNPSANLTKAFERLPFAVGRNCGNDAQATDASGPVAMLALTGLLIALAVWAESAEYFRNNPTDALGKVRLNSERASLLKGADAASVDAAGPKLARSKLGNLLAQFLPSRNLAVLFAKSQARSLGGLDGMRSFSMLWIILGHTSLFTTFQGELNPASTKDVLQSLPQQFVYSAAFGVDTFFFISGMLTAYTMMNKLRKRIRPIGQLPGQTALFVLLRWLRLTPVFAYVLFMYTFIGSVSSSGPFWYRMVEETKYCHEHWWANMLYVNNYIPGEYHEMCMAWSWYLANDMQFFIVALILMFIYVRSARVGGGITLFLTLATTVVGYFIVVPLNSAEYQNQFYDKPWTRLPPFSAGMLLGMILRDTSLKNTKLSRHVAAGLMSTSVLTILFVFYIQYDRYTQAGYDDPLAQLDSRWSKYDFAAYNSFGRLLYILALMLMCALNASGNGGMVYNFLTLPFWEPMGKLTYGAYLIHPVILRVWYYQKVQLFAFNPIEQAMCFLAATSASYACAVFTYCLIEAPCDGLVKKLMGAK